VPDVIMIDLGLYFIKLLKVNHGTRHLSPIVTTVIPELKTGCFSNDNL